MNFMRGDCHIFAVALEEFSGGGLRAYEAVVDGKPHHAFATDGSRFIDARGWFNSFGELVAGMYGADRAEMRLMSEQDQQAYWDRYDQEEIEDIFEKVEERVKSGDAS